MTLGLLLKMLHVFSAFGIVAGAFGRNMTFSLAAKSTELPAIQSLLTASEQFERWLFFPSMLTVTVFGLLTAWIQGWPMLGFLQGASANWLLVSLVIWFGFGTAVGALLGPRRRARQKALEEALTQGRVTGELSAALNDAVVSRTRLVEIVGLIVLIWLMTAKPI